MKQREEIISNYISAYNNFDVDRMIADMDDNMVFENVSGGETNMRILGLGAFREQASKAVKLFTERKQTVTAIQHHENETEISIQYHGVLAIDLPDGLKAGEELQLDGKSIFTFSGNKITGLKDIS